MTDLPVTIFEDLDCVILDPVQVWFNAETRARRQVLTSVAANLKRVVPKPESEHGVMGLEKPCEPCRAPKVQVCHVEERGGGCMNLHVISEHLTHSEGF